MFLSPIVSCSSLKYRPVADSVVVIDDVTDHELRDNEEIYMMTRSLPRSSTLKQLPQLANSPCRVTHRSLLPVVSPPSLFDCDISYIRLSPTVSIDDTPTTRSTCSYPATSCCNHNDDVISHNKQSPMVQCSSTAFEARLRRTTACARLPFTKVQTNSRGTLTATNDLQEKLRCRAEDVCNNNNNENVLMTRHTITIRRVRGRHGYGMTLSGGRPCRIGSLDVRGPAAEAGLKLGDIISRVNGHRVLGANTDGLARIIRVCSTHVTLEVMRTAKYKYVHPRHRLPPPACNSNSSSSSDSSSSSSNLDES